MLFESKIELGEKFFNEIIHNPVPLDMNILGALKRSPLGLDLYMWLTYRTFGLDSRSGCPGRYSTGSSGRTRTERATSARLTTSAPTVSGS